MRRGGGEGPEGRGIGHLNVFISRGYGEIHVRKGEMEM